MSVSSRISSFLGPLPQDRRQALGVARGLLNGNLGIPLLLIILLGMMILPLPAFLLDVFFSFNIALSIVVLLVGIYALRPLDFAVFPTILLVATLLRLALNVASTRVVLLEGHQGGDAAGKVIQAFGEVVIGGNYAVGLVVFIILMIINFVVVTKGAGRISEVSARFTLDAMPGKQMAIDADLNAGIIDQEQARTRREEVASEADFYGAMDGASKFVRGDAVAGIMILLINVAGGLIIGMAQHGLPLMEAVEKYILLTIGDGLVAQIPSLLLSIAAAIMVTRVNSSEDVRSQVFNQMFASPKALGVSSAILFLMGSVPGMPHVAFLGLALVCAGFAFWLHRRQQQELIPNNGSAPFAHRQTGGMPNRNPSLPSPNDDVVAEQGAETPELSWEDVAPVDPIGLEVGYRLIPLVNRAQGGELLNRIKGIRKQLSQEQGFLIPSVHIKDNLDLEPNRYRILLFGVVLGEGEVFPDREMAINPGQAFGPIDGQETKDPAFGLDAIWIEQNKKEEAQALGYTVVDAGSVIATHMNQVLLQHVHELLSHEDMQQLLDQLSEAAPKLVGELVPDTLPLHTVMRVCQGLLQEKIAIRDMRTICTALLGAAAQSKDEVFLLERVRIALARHIVFSLSPTGEALSVLTLDPELEQILLKANAQAQKNGAEAAAFVDPALFNGLQEGVRASVQRQEMAAQTAILLVAAPLRTALVKIVRSLSLDAHVLSYQEVPDNKTLNIAGVVRVEKNS